jgi:phage-related baseplate assembly protein
MHKAQTKTKRQQIFTHTHTLLQFTSSLLSNTLLSAHHQLAASAKVVQQKAAASAAAAVSTPLATHCGEDDLPTNAASFTCCAVILQLLTAQPGADGNSSK